MSNELLAQLPQLLTVAWLLRRWPHLLWRYISIVQISTVVVIQPRIKSRYNVRSSTFVERLDIKLTRPPNLLVLDFYTSVSSCPNQKLAMGSILNAAISSSVKLTASDVPRV